MKKTPMAIRVELGIFSIGISYALYAFIQYILTPICWWVTHDIVEIEIINQVFEIYEYNGMKIFTLQSVFYSVIGIITFFSGYFFFPAKIFRKETGIIIRGWDVRRVEVIFWGLLLTGFAIKTLKILLGVSIEEVVEINIKHSYLLNPIVIFYLSLNWFHLLALIVINVTYQEAKKENLSSQKRLMILTYVYTIFYLTVSLTTGGKTATFFPLLGLLIIKKYYYTKSIHLLKTIILMSALVIFVFVVKQLLVIYFEAEGYDIESSLIFSLVYILFNRLNMSHVMVGVIEKGKQAFPDGTLGQFWVDMAFYGLGKQNVFDGNEFGRAIGVAMPHDYSTGVAVTNMGDLYINFGILGIIFGMFLTGILYKILFSNCQQRAPFFVMIFALMWPILIHGMESPVTVLYAVSIKMTTLCLLVHLAIVYKLPMKPSKNISTPIDSKKIEV